MKVLAYVPDLMDKSRFRGIDGEVTFVNSPQDLAGTADVVVADLSRPKVIEALGSIETPKVGFFSHVEDETREAAIAAGVRVYARSAFFSRLVTILNDSH